MVTSLTPGGLPKVTTAPKQRLPFSSAAPQQQQKPMMQQSVQQSVGTNSPANTQATLAASKTVATSATMAVGATALQSFALPQDTQRLRSGTERALTQLESRYQA